MKGKAVKISLITPVLNAGDALTATLESVAWQSVSPFEHIIIDGYSTDNSFELCRRYAECVSYTVRIIRAQPKGVYDALNRGIKQSVGEVVGVLHGADCFASADVLAAVSSAFSLDEELALTYADIVYKQTSGKRGRYYSGAGFTPGSLKWGFMFPHPSMYVRRKLYESYGLYSTHYKVAGDFEWLVRVLLHNKINTRYLPVCTVEMMPGGVSSNIHNRVGVTPREKLAALRANGFKVCPLRMCGRYIKALISIFQQRHD